MSQRILITENVWISPGLRKEQEQLPSVTGSFDFFVFTTGTCKVCQVITTLFESLKALTTGIYRVIAATLKASSIAGTVFESLKVVGTVFETLKAVSTVFKSLSNADVQQG